MRVTGLFPEYVTAKNEAISNHDGMILPFLFMFYAVTNAGLSLAGCGQVGTTVFNRIVIKNTRYVLTIFCVICIMDL